MNCDTPWIKEWETTSPLEDILPQPTSVHHLSLLSVRSIGGYVGTLTVLFIPMSESVWSVYSNDLWVTYPQRGLCSYADHVNV